MDSSTQSTPKVRGAGKNKRKWSNTEDENLMEALMDMYNKGDYKADTGFKSGYLNKLEDDLRVKLPGSNLKTKPHIESRIKTLKRDFFIVQDMLLGNTSGFGWNDEMKCVVAEKSVWNDYLKSHPEAYVWKNRTFLYYEDLSIIYGKDRATGKDAEAPADAAEEIQREDLDNHGVEDVLEDEMNVNLEFMTSASRGPNSEGSSSRRTSKKRSRNVDSLSEDITEAAMIVGADIREATEKFSRVIGVELETVGLIGKVNEVISTIPDITMMERHKAARIITCDQETVVLFLLYSR